MLKRIFVVIVLILSMRGVVFSQEVIDLRTAVNTAINNDPVVSQLKNTIDVQKLYIKSTKGSLYPTLSFSGDYSRTNSFNKGGVINQNGYTIHLNDESRTSETYGLGLSSNLMLFDGFANYKNIELARQNEASSSISYEKAKYDIIIDVYQKYYSVVKDENVVMQNELILKDAKDLLAKIQEYVNVGSKTISDVYKQDAQVAQNELDLESASSNLFKARVDLLNAMSLNLDKEFEIDPKFKNISMSASDLLPILNQYSNANALIQSALESRYDYRLAQNQAHISELEVDIAKRNLYSPTLSAFGNYNISGDHFGDIANSRIFTVGLSLNYSIFQGFQLDVQSQVAEVNVQQRNLDLKLLEKQITSDLKKAVLDLTTNYKQVEIIERSLKSAEQDKILSEENFRIGYGTLLDVQVATTRYNNLSIQKINAIYDFLISREIIEYLAGRLKY